MGREQLVNILRYKTGMTIDEADAAIVVILETIQEELAAGGFFSMRRFGKFDTVRKKARAVHNVWDGQPAVVSARTVPRFRAGLYFKNRVNEGFKYAT